MSKIEQYIHNLKLAQEELYLNDRLNLAEDVREVIEFLESIESLYKE